MKLMSEVKELLKYAVENDETADNYSIDSFWTSRIFMTFLCVFFVKVGNFDKTLHVNNSTNMNMYKIQN